MTEKGLSVLLVLTLASFAGMTALLRSEGAPIDASIAVPEDSPVLPPYGFFKGISPNNRSDETVQDAFANASLHSHFVPVPGEPSPFYELPEDLSGPWGTELLDDLIRGNGMFPLVQVDLFEDDMELMAPPDLAPSNLSDQDWRGSFIDAVLRTVNVSRPRYLSIGVDVNLWYEAFGAAPADENGFQHFVSLYEASYDAVKTISPDTVVFCAFAREVGTEMREADISVLSLFDPSKLDMVVLSSRPYTVPGIGSVGDIPDDYYSCVLDHITGKPFGLVDAAWPSGPAFGGEQEQSSFIRNITGRLTTGQGLDLSLLSWPRTTDIDQTDTLGLICTNGTEKASYHDWWMNKGPSFRRENRTVTLLEDFGQNLYPLGLTFFDPDPWDSLSYQVWNGTAYSNITMTQNLGVRIDGGYLVLDSVANVTGTFQVNVRATDWMGARNSTLLQIIVENVNDPPGRIGNSPLSFSMVEGHSPYIDMRHFVYDPEEALSELTTEVEESPNLVVSLDLAASPYLIAMTEDEDWFGDTYVLLGIMDSEGASTRFNISFRVVPVNDPPSIAAPDRITIDEDSEMRIDLSGWGFDVDNDTLTWTAHLLDGDNLSLAISDHVLTMVPDDGWHGTATIRLTLSDGLLDTTCLLEVIVSSINDVPTAIAERTVVLPEDGTAHFDLSSFDPYDADGDAFFFIVEDIPDIVASASVQSNGTLKIVPETDSFGNGTIDLVLSDGRGGRLDLSLMVEIEPVNDPPLFYAPRNWSISLEEGERAHIDLGSFPFIVEDVDDPFSSLTVHSDDPFLTAEGLLIEIKVPVDANVTDHIVQVSIKDGSGGVSLPQKLFVHIELGDIEGGPSVNITEISYLLHDGTVIITVKGGPDQTLWAVFYNGSALRGSFRLVEGPPGSGNYSISISGADWKDGEGLSFHISSERDGNNDSTMPSTAFIYERRSGEDGHGAIVLYLMIAILAVLILMTCYMLLAGRKGSAVDISRGPIPEE